MDARAAEEQLLRVVEVGMLLSWAMAEVVDDPLLVNNAPVALLCHLDMDGPMRPAEIVDLTGLTSGGVSKLIDRLEGAGVVKRERHPDLEDERGVLVELTPRGRTTIRRLGERLAELLPGTGALFEELKAVLTTSKSRLS